MPAVEESRSTGLSQRALDLFRSVDLTRLAPSVQLFVHLHQTVLDGTPGVARVEGSARTCSNRSPRWWPTPGSPSPPWSTWPTGTPWTATNTPKSIRHRTRLRTPAEAAPHATRITGMAQRIDLDHPTPYRPTGPPKQTGDHNAAPLTRTSHRAKTHLGYRVAQIGTDAWVWRTPHGLLRIVDAHGTHLADPADIDALTSPDPLERSIARLWWQHCASKAA